jgi:hypothetical protein
LISGSDNLEMAVTCLVFSRVVLPDASKVSITPDLLACPIRVDAANNLEVVRHKVLVGTRHDLSRPHFNLHDQEKIRALMEEIWNAGNLLLRLPQYSDSGCAQ